MYRNDVARLVQSVEKFNSTVGYLRGRFPVMAGFADARSLIDALHDPEGDRDTKDAVLLALIVEYQRTRNAGVFGVLLVAMFPALDNIYGHKTWHLRRRAVAERNDVWSEVLTAFAEASAAYPVERRPSRVAGNLRGETLRVLAQSVIARKREGTARQRFAAEISALGDTIGVDSPDGGEEMVGWNALFGATLDRVMPTEMDTVEGIEKLAEHSRSGVISEGEAAVLRGLLLGRSLLEVAHDLGVSRNAAKLRSSRAVRALKSQE
jgi:hypothetical protein